MVTIWVLNNGEIDTENSIEIDDISSVGQEGDYLILYKNTDDEENKVVPLEEVGRFKLEHIAGYNIE